jgi:Dynamin family
MTEVDDPTAGEEADAGAPSPAVAAMLETLFLASRAVRAYGRDDLAGRVEGARGRLRDPAFHVLVVGEFKQGKSTLINSLLDTSICPVDDDIATSAPTAVRFGDPPEATVYLEPEREGDDLVEQSIAVDDVQDYVTEAANPANERRVKSVEVGLPLPFLSDGLVFVDTPGVGGLGSVHGTITIGALPMADGVLFVSDASQEFSAPELQFLKTAHSMCPNLLCLLTKTDFYPAWRKIRDLDTGHLHDARIDVQLLPVSSVLHQQAAESADAALDAESGVPALVETLRRDIVGGGEERAVLTAAAALDGIVDQLEAQFVAERRALKDPEKAGELTRELERAREHATQMKGQSASWAQTLGDGIADLMSEVDHDLRGRFRRIIQEADESIEVSDPIEIWGEFEPWLYRRVAEDVVANYAFLQQQANALSDEVAKLFAGEADALPLRAELGDPRQVLATTAVRAAVEFDAMTGGQKVMTGFRGGYIGVLMFGALGSMVGLALGALPVAAGMMMGRKALKDEKKRELNNRRILAKNALRRYVDEVQFLTGKDSRDTLRRVQRQLRDYYTARADELQRSLGETLSAAQLAVKSDQETRNKRLRDVEAEIERIRGLRVQANEAKELAAAGASPDPAAEA